MTLAFNELPLALRDAREPVDVVDETGRVMGRYQPLTVQPGGRGCLPPGVKSPFTDEEIEAARKEPDSGVPLDEFWRQVRSGEWK